MKSINVEETMTRQCSVRNRTETRECQRENGYFTKRIKNENVSVANTIKIRKEHLATRPLNNRIYQTHTLGGQHTTAVTIVDRAAGMCDKNKN